MLLDLIRSSVAETGMSSGLDELDIEAMKERLRAQQQLLHNLYAELDQEREASASAASETLDMILRLQEEKAAVKMEAVHYKRMAEEKIHHAEATLERLEELMHHEEMEMASLVRQVQAYKRKLESLGCDLNAIEFELPEQNEENIRSSNVSRLCPLPHYKNSLRTTPEVTRSTSLILDRKMEQITEQEFTVQSLDLASKSGDFACGTHCPYWTQIKRLEKGKWKSSSIFSQTSKITCDQTDIVSSTGLVNNVYDVFEVPQSSENHKVRERWKRTVEILNVEEATPMDDVCWSPLQEEMQNLHLWLLQEDHLRKPIN